MNWFWTIRDTGDPTGTTCDVEGRDGAFVARTDRRYSNLISAAPELYAALDRLVKLADEEFAGVAAWRVSERGSLRSLCMFALQKAKGGNR